MIVLKNIYKDYNGKQALNDLNLSVREGELFGFLGPNGAGKTTALKILTLLLEPASGEILLNNRLHNEKNRKNLMDIGYIPDRPYIYPKLTGKEFLLFYLSIYNISFSDNKRHKMEELAEQFEILDILDELTESYSHGMKQKLIFTAIFLQDPLIFLIDEPMVGLDPRGIVSIKKMLSAQARMGKSIIMSTHSLDIAEEICDTIGIINKGRLIKIMSREELKKEKQDQQSNLTDIFLTLTTEKTSTEIL